MRWYHPPEINSDHGVILGKNWLDGMQRELSILVQLNPLAINKKT